ncbi:TetR/AcrR family transcriptional regulator [Mycobacteroides chelonae]|uniref:TetR/AcrR family transcriptional regulator n=1 Tax=Mycobacteroides chelonae TaxID=1774 RepID=UPI0004AB1F1A|nr:TetR/AcrR family transcriptional regulator [Mycobacteroides chelonae]MBF9318835.1 TetR/AcrR family transcriptional regulator [Mycobacteroides chelonae]OHT70209.1 TetR family transcriptional regulator [Mycobacteroides chelonae]OHT71142.1 TetR family transcriptional regulator [Mycobacteroides chelonae]OHT85638.1 TetR family transcriptional regulator [Mycobacteroides chelonae]
MSGLADKRRQQIVDAAFAAFTENGYEQTSMSDIAARAGMGQGTVYRYVDSKREVLDLVFDYGVERLVDTLALDDFLEVVGGGTAGIEERNDIIMEGGRRLYALVDQEPALLKLLTVQSAAADKELKQRVLGIQSMLDSYVQRGLDGGRRAGWLAEDAQNHAVLARLLPALVLPGFLLAQSRHDNPGTRERFVSTASQIAESGILRDGVALESSAGHSAAETVDSVHVPVPVAADRRNELLDAALGCFLSAGYHAVGVNEIVERLGVSHGTFYNYYQNKRDLLDALMVREFSAMEPVLSRPVGRLDARQDIENALVQGFTNALEAVAERLPALIFVCTEAAGVDPEALQSIIQFFRFASVRSEQSVYSMIGADRINPSIDTEFLGQAFVSLLVGAVTLVVDDDGRTDRIDEYARAITHFLLYGLNPAP